ncbi:hypothetical protein GCM10027082_20040 [Comamonas humi]
MEVKRQELFGTAIVLAPDKVGTNAIRIAFTQLELTQRHRIASGFVDLFSNLDGLYERADLIANEVRSLAIEQAMKALAAHGLYEVSEQQFFEQFMDPYDSWDQDFEPIADAYEAMVEHTANLDAYRTARRQNRAKWVGLNEHSVYQADGKNFVSNVGHGVFNLMAKGVTAIGNAIKKDEIFKSPQTLVRVRDGIGDIVAAAREGTIEALKMLKPGAVYLYSQDEAARAAAIIEHVRKGRVPDADLLPALLRAIDAFPYNRDAYVLLLQHSGCDAGRLDEIVAYFGLAVLDPERKQLFEVRRRGTDLSTLEALDVHLPELIAYAEAIGYTPFAQEAVTLREAAARQVFDSRVRILGEASVADIQAQLDALRVYAVELGIDGAETALAQVLTAARLREFNQEAAKHPLASLEDCDRSLPHLDAYARRIGFDGFNAWAEMARQRAATPVPNKAKEVQTVSISSDASNANGKASSKPIEMVLGFAVIGLVSFGGFKAYAHFTAPAETAPAALVLPKEAATPIPVMVPLAPPSAPQPPAATSGVVDSKQLRPLSPAAEEAIREGFVEINDPSVQACTDAKIADFRKEMGEDAVLRFDIHNEFAVDCGFNI